MEVMEVNNSVDDVTSIENAFFKMAKELLSNGISFFPLPYKSKIPSIKWGEFQEKLPSEDKIKEWFSHTDKVGLALVTGRFSGVCVIDADTAEGLAWCEKNLPPTPIMQHTLHGRHYFFRYPANVEIKGTKRFVPGVDCRGRGNYVRIWPSIHGELDADGKEFQYRFTSETREWDKLPELPQWLIENINGDTSENINVDLSGVKPFGMIETPPPVSKGERNNTLAVYVGELFAQRIPYAEVEQKALDWNDRCNPPQPLSDVHKTIASIWRKDCVEHPERHTPTPTPSIQAPAGGEEKGLPDVLPLVRATPPAAPYPVHCFGDFAQTITDVAERQLLPVPMVGNTMLAIFSLMAQGLANIVTSSEATRTPLSLFCMTVAPSGVGKSTCDSIFMRPIWKKQEKLQEAWREEQDHFEAALAAYNLEETTINKQKNLTMEERTELLAKLKKKRPIQPLMPYLYIGDFNWEGLFKHLQYGRPAMGVFSDEAALLFGGVGFAPENEKKMCGGLSSLWSGKPVDKGRSGDGSIVLHDRRVACHLMMQNVIAEGVFSNQTFQQQGYLPRQLVSWTDIAELDCEKDKQGLHGLRSLGVYYRACEALLEKPLKRKDDGGIIFEEIRLTDDAEAIYSAYSKELKRLRNPNEIYAPVEAYGARAAENALRIAGCLLLIHNPDARVLTLDFMQRGIELSRWYMDEILRVTLASVASSEVKVADMLLRWLIKNQIPTVGTRMVIQYGPGALREAKPVEAAIATLVQHGWLLPLPGGSEISFRGKTQKVRRAWRCRLECAAILEERAQASQKTTSPTPPTPPQSQNDDIDFSFDELETSGGF